VPEVVALCCMRSKETRLALILQVPEIILLGVSWDSLLTDINDAWPQRIVGDAPIQTVAIARPVQKGCSKAAALVI